MKRFSDIGKAQFLTSTGEQVCFPPGGRSCGTVLLLDVEFATDGSEAVGDLIYLGRLPSGGRVVPALCSATSEGLGTTLTVAVGTEAAPECYATGLALYSAGTKGFSGGAVKGFESQKQEWVVAKVTAASGVTAGKVCRFVVAYVTN